MITMGKLLLSIFLIIFAPTTVRSSTCVQSETFCQAYDYFPLIITGKVIRVRDYKIFREYDIEVNSIIKGTSLKVITVQSYKDGICSKGPELVYQQIYLLYIHTIKNRNFVKYEKFSPKLLSESNQDLIELNKIKLMSVTKRKSCASIFQRPKQNLRTPL